MKEIDGKQIMVLKKQRLTKEREEVIRQANPVLLEEGKVNGGDRVKQIILKESSNIRHLGHLSPRMSEVIQRVSTSPNKKPNTKKVSPIIISKYKSEHSPLNTRETSHESKRISIRETEKVYLSSKKPGGLIQKIRSAKPMKVVRSVSPLIRKKKVEPKGRSMLPSKKISYNVSKGANRIVFSNTVKKDTKKVSDKYPSFRQQEQSTEDIAESYVIRRNEKEILEMNRRENGHEVGVNRFVKKTVPVKKTIPVKKFGENSKIIKRVRVDDRVNGRSVTPQRIKKSNGSNLSGVYRSNVSNGRDVNGNGNDTKKVTTFGEMYIFCSLLGL